MKIIWFVIGVIMGLVAKGLSKKLIQNRAGTQIPFRLYGSRQALVWAGLSGASFLIIGILSGGNSVQAIESMLVFTICLTLSAVDFEIKKIPNVLLISLILLKVIMLITARENPSSSIFGLFFAFAVFSFPARFGKAIGAGDIKLATAAGFYLGVWGFIEAVAIMGICLLVYWAYLYITRKGGLRTSVALGPYISIGLVIAQCIKLPLSL